MAPDDGPAVRPSGTREPATEGAGTPLRGDLVCKNPFPQRAPDKVQTVSRHKLDEPSTDRRRKRRHEMDADTGLNDVLAAARRQSGARGGGGHSPLYEWLWARFDALSVELSPPRRPNWRSVADAMAALAQSGDTSVLDGWGEVPGSETVRQTWWRVRKDKAATRRRTPDARGSGGEVASVSRAVPPAAGPSPLPADPSPMPGQRSVHRFGTGIRPKTWTQASDFEE